MKGLLKGLFSIWISIISIVSFCSSENISNKINLLFSWSVDWYYDDCKYNNLLFDITDSWNWTYCVKFSNVNWFWNGFTLNLWFQNSFNWTCTSAGPSNIYKFYNDQYWNWICLYWNKPMFTFQRVSWNTHISFDYEVFKLTDLLDTDLPQYTYYTPNWTWVINWDFIVRNMGWNYINTELQNLPNWVWLDLYFNSSAIDSNYCESNNLCPIYTWDSWNCNTWDISWSSVYINDIQHVGGPSINIDIPEEISWDYNYSNTDDMYINVEWYNVDYDKINGIVDIQNYKPNSEDFNKLVSEVLPLLIPWLVVILFLYFIFRFIKKIF